MASRHCSAWYWLIFAWSTYTPFVSFGHSDMYIVYIITYLCNHNYIYIHSILSTFIHHLCWVYPTHHHMAPVQVAQKVPDQVRFFSHGRHGHGFLRWQLWPLLGSWETWVHQTKNGKTWRATRSRSFLFMIFQCFQGWVDGKQILWNPSNRFYGNIYIYCSIFTKLDVPTSICLTTSESANITSNITCLYISWYYYFF